MARYLLGELADIEALVTELPGFGHAVAAIATASSSSVCTFNLCTTASWYQRNAHVEIFGKGHVVWVDNVDTCTHRPPERPERVWRPNYTLPIPAHAGPTVMGFLPELEHFRAVAMDGVENLSDMASAAKTLALAERLCAITGVSESADSVQARRKAVALRAALGTQRPLDSPASRAYPAAAGTDKRRR